MFRYPDGSYRVSAPAKVEFEGYIRNFADLTRAEWDELGYNEAVAVQREPFTTYETEWVKGDDFVYREIVVSSIVDEEMMDAHESEVLKKERDRLLAESDWTQLADVPMTEENKGIWAEYRQSLRDAPSAAGWPRNYTFPDPPTEL